MRVRLAVVALVLALVGVLAPTAASARVPAGFAGLVSEDAYAGTDAYQAEAIARQRSTGFTLLRQTFKWQDIEPTPGTYDFSATDRFVLNAARSGVRVLPVLFGEPAWATARPASAQAVRATYPPRDLSTFAAFATAVAKRYGPGGALWAANPTVRPVPITAYQVWNEPNLKAYWRGSPSASGYVKLLRATATALRAAQPGVQVVTGGMPQSRSGVDLNRYLGQLYRAGAARYMDTVAINAYAGSAAGVLARLRSARRVMDRAGGRGDGIWATEFGWSDNGPRRGFRVTSAKQASLVASTFRTLARARGSLKLRGVVYFGWRDLPVYAGGKDFWGLHTGLLRLDGSAKPALAAIKTALRSLP